MIEPYDFWRFEVDTEKAVRRGISVDTINRNLAMAMGGVKVGDVKRGTVQEPTYIVIQVPLSYRSEITTPRQPADSDRRAGRCVPLARARALRAAARGSHHLSQGSAADGVCGRRDGGPARRADLRHVRRRGPA